MVPCSSQYSKRTSRARNIPGVEQTKKWNRANILYSCSYTLYWGMCVMWKYRLLWDYIGFWRLHILWCIYLLDIDGNNHPKSLYNNDDDWYQQERLYNCHCAYEIFCNIYPSQFSQYIYMLTFYQWSYFNITLIYELNEDTLLLHVSQWRYLYTIKMLCTRTVVTIIVPSSTWCDIYSGG